MPAVAIGETMYADNAVFEPHGHFIGWVCLVFVPKPGIIQQAPQLDGYLPFVYANVLVGFAKPTLPCPHIGIHALMHHADERFRKTVSGLKERPNLHCTACSICCCSNSSNSPRVAMVEMSSPSFSSSSKAETAEVAPFCRKYTCISWNPSCQIEGLPILETNS